MLYDSIALSLLVARDTLNSVVANPAAFSTVADVAHMQWDV